MVSERCARGLPDDFISTAGVSPYNHLAGHSVTELGKIRCFSSQPVELDCVGFCRNDGFGFRKGNAMRTIANLFFPMIATFLLNSALISCSDNNDSSSGEGAGQLGFKGNVRSV